MKKSLGWITALMCVALLFSAVSLSAQTEKSTSQAHSLLTANIVAVPSVLPPGVLMDRDDWNKDDKDWKKDGDKDGDGDGDKDDHHHKYHHDATPEPSTLLSFGAAILIGGGVLYSRRLRKSK